MSLTTNTEGECNTSKKRDDMERKREKKGKEAVRTPRQPKKSARQTVTGSKLELEFCIENSSQAKTTVTAPRLFFTLFTSPVQTRPSKAKRTTPVPQPYPNTIEKPKSQGPGEEGEEEKGEKIIKGQRKNPIHTPK